MTHRLDKLFQFTSYWFPNNGTRVLSFCIWLWREISQLGQVDRVTPYTWWRHQMETFSVLLALCVGNSPVLGEFPAQRSMTQSFDVFFDLHLNKRLRKQSKRRWFETPSHPLWRHCSAICVSTSANTWLLHGYGYEYGYLWYILYTQLYSIFQSLKKGFLRFL